MTLMKVLLTLPPLHSPIKANFVDSFDNESGQYPPIGLLYLAGYLLEHSQYEVHVLDPQAEKLSHEETIKRIVAIGPDVVGVHMLTFHLIDSLKMIQNIKKILPKTRIICGGPHVHIYPRETLMQPGIDFTLVGECEQTFKIFLDYLENKCPITDVNALYYFDHEGNIQNTTRSPLLANLDELPHPARNLLNPTFYSSVLAKQSVTTTLMTSRGCPYKCIYCDRPVFGKDFRARSPENVLEEIEQCIQLGIFEFNIFDDTFTIDRERVIAICNLIIERKLPIRWTCRSRVHLVSEEILDRMKKAGCGRISFGIETADDKVGRILKKGSDIDQAKYAIRATKAAGIEVLADFIIGSPGESRNGINKTISFALEESPNYAQFSIMTPYPATPLYAMGLNTKLYKFDHWREFARNPDPNWETPIWHENFTKRELIKIVKQAYFKFYFRPEYLFTQLRSLQSFNELKRKARAGLKVFTTKFTPSLTA